MDVMQTYGVVCSIEKVESGRNDLITWKILYSSADEVKSASDCLTVEGLNFQTDDPRRLSGDKSKNTFARGGHLRESERPLVGKKGREYEMKELGHCTSTNPHHNTADQDWYLPQKGICCSRFCAHFSKYPVKLCYLPRLIWWILIFICCVFVPVVIYVIARFFKLEIFRTYRDVPFFGQILLWLPATTAATSVIVRGIWAMCHSQRKRIHDALDGTKSKMAYQLGFMNKVKNEVAVITRLLHCARFTHQRDYKVFITIDDLDRVPLTKVKSVLEAVNILLSDKSSPFICLIAVDPRIVVKCIEEGSGYILAKANVTGHEYLKKIINIPVCLPEVGANGKKRFIAGLIDQADRAVTYRNFDSEITRNTITETSIRNPRTKSDGETVSPETNIADISRKDVVDAGTTTDNESKNVKFAGTDQGRVRSAIASHDDCGEELDEKSFLFHCRKFFYYNEEVQRHLQGSPRNIKRIFNIISLTAGIINSMVKKHKRRLVIQSTMNELTRGSVNEITSQVALDIVRTRLMASNLVHWIVLTDQWPFRTSFILQIIEDADQREKAGIEKEALPEDCSILEIFE